MTRISKKSENKAKVLQIFNLEFPSYIEELKIGDYVFKRTKDYKQAFDSMMHLVNSFGREFNTQIKVGSHQITAIVEIAQKEKNVFYHLETKN